MTKRNKLAKFDKKNPGAYIPATEWKKLDAAQQTAAREARKKKGIPVRQVGAIRTRKVKYMGTTKDEDKSDEEAPEEAAVAVMPPPEAASPPVNISTLKKVPPSLLVAPPARAFALTQRESLYGRNTARLAAANVVEDCDRKMAALTTKDQGN